MRVNPPLTGVEQRPQRAKRAIPGIESQFSVAASSPMPRHQIGPDPRVTRGVSVICSPLQKGEGLGVRLSNSGSDGIDD
jgi:hypothetical protein